jgi:origin recognition complex subunit 5
LSRRANTVSFFSSCCRSCWLPQYNPSANLDIFQIRGAPSRNIVLHGLCATGKTAITRALLEKLSSLPQPNGLANGHHNGDDDELRYAIIKSAECISGRHLLEQTIGAVARATEWRGELSSCQSIAHLVVEIGKMMEKWTESDDQSAKRRLVLTFDGVDHQRDIPPTLLPALGRMGEVVSSKELSMPQIKD